MSLASALADRLDAAVPALGHRIGTAAQLAEAMRIGALPQVTPAAYVLPLGLRGGAPNAATGIFRQEVGRMVGVVLVVRSAADPLGAKAIDELGPLIEAVIKAICGWAPDDAVGVFRLSRGELVSTAGGACTYQLDFALDDQLRITS